ITMVAEQSALRRVAEQVARQAPPGEVFALVTEELGRLLDVSMVRTVRFERDGSATVVAARVAGEELPPQGTNVAIPPGSVVDQVYRTAGPARVADYGRGDGRTDIRLGMRGARSGVGGPIVVDGRLWGAMVVGAGAGEALPPGSEQRVAAFTELVSTAISN